jgi:hypothetical protein
MCLFANVNAMTIWKTLYTDQQLRTTFAQDYSRRALEFADQAAQKAQSEQTKSSTGSKTEIEDQSRAFRGNMETFLADVNFGVGRIWRQKNPPVGGGGFAYEFFGSLLTGVLVSIGAPYWHDLLRALSNLRNTPPSTN